MKKLGQMILLTFVLSLGFGHPAIAQPAMQAELPDFPVTLNGIEMLDMRTGQYPLLVYQDVTYFPMTWYNCRMLGLETQWSDALGLEIAQNNALTSSIGYYPRDGENPPTVSVQAVNFPVTVNGQVIDNSKEPYPLIRFRDVTYFPLTWRFAHDAFGWAYEYTLEKGLNITSTNPQTVYFPALEGRECNTPIRLLDNGCYYYLHKNQSYHEETVKTTFSVYRAPIDNSFRVQELYTFEQEPYTVDFAMLDGEPYILYQQNAGDNLQALHISDHAVQAATVDLRQYVNGSSQGDKQDGWQYKLSDDGRLTRTQDGKVWQTYSTTTADWFGLLDGQVYYLHKDGKNGNQLYQATGNKADKLLMSDKVRAATIQDGYLVCLLAEDEDYGAKIFDGQGRLILAITGTVNSISLSDNIVLAVTKVNDDQDFLKVIRLK